MTAKIVGKAVLIGSLACFAVVVLLVLTFRTARTFEDKRYAADVFDGVVAYSEVVASGRWHSKVDGFGCSFAVVELSPDAATSPPVSFGRKSGNRPDPFLDFGGDWKPTPSDALIDRSGDGPWIFCRTVMDRHLFDRLDSALRRPGGWWTGSQDEIHFYSAGLGLAFRLWQGD